MEDWDDDALDEGPGEHDAHLLDDDASADVDTTPCPDCDEPVWRDADACPHCGHWFTADDRDRAAAKPWVVTTAVILLVVMLFFLQRFGRAIL